MLMFYYDYKITQSEILSKKKREIILQSGLQARLPRKNINKNENTRGEKNRKETERERDDSDNIKTGSENENEKGLIQVLYNFIKTFHQEFLSKPWKFSEWEEQTFELKLTSDRRILKGAESSLFLCVQVS